jgi:hypothetical protein
VKEIGGVIVIDLGTNEKSQGSDDLRLSLLHMYVARVRRFWGGPCPLVVLAFIVVRCIFLIIVIGSTTFKNKGTQ